MIPIILLFISWLDLALVFLSWRKSTAPAVLPFCGMMFSLFIWSLGYALEIFVPSLEVKILFAKIEYLGIVAVPVFWLGFSLEYTGRLVWRSWRNGLFLWIVPLTTLILVWTNENHHWIWKEMRLVQSAGLTLMQVEHGNYFWFHTLYSYLLLLIGSVLLIVESLRAAGLYRAQATIVLLGILSPWLGNAVYLSGYNPFPGLDLTPFFFVPTGLALAWGISRYSLMDVIPLAYPNILNGLRDGLIVIDAHKRLLFINRMAERILGVSAARFLGRSLEEIQNHVVEEVKALFSTLQQHVNVKLQVDGEPRSYFLDVQTIQSAHRNASLPSQAKLIVFRDVTEEEAAKLFLQRHDAILHTVSVAAEQFLKTSPWEVQVPAVLERLGRAADVSRVYIFENQLAEDGNLLTSQRFEWVAEGITPQINNPDLQNFPLRAAGFARWEEAFLKGEAIHGLISTFPQSEQQVLSDQEIQSLVVMPIFVEGHLWGFIGLDECRYPRVWTDLELEALRIAADIFGAALAREHIESGLRERQYALNMLNEIVLMALGASDIPSMARTLVDHLGMIIGAHGCFLTLWDEANQITIPLAAYGPFRESYPRVQVLPGERTLTSSVLEVGRALVIEDIKQSPYISPRVAAMFPTISALVLPLIAGERKLGAIILGFNEPHRFTRQEVALGELAARQLSLAMIKVRLLEEAQRRLRHQIILQEAGAIISSSLEVEDVFKRLAEQLCKAIEATSAYILDFDEGSGLATVIAEYLSSYACEAERRSDLGSIFPVAQDEPEFVAKMQAGKHDVSHIDDEHLSEKERQHMMEYGAQSILYVPLKVKDQLIGFAEIWESRHRREFTQEEINLCLSISQQAAVALESARLFAEVQRLATTDELTSLYNRRQFFELAHREHYRAQRYRRPLSLLMVDIDRFKKVNDRFGHRMGDQVLQRLAGVFQHEVREIDIVGRYGGEEFLILLAETDLVGAEKVAERLRKDVDELVLSTPQGEVHVTVSIGVAGDDAAKVNLAELVELADKAMYAAKDAGRNCVRAIRV